MSKDKIEVNMNVYDIPILVEALEEANKETERLHSIIKEAVELLEKYGLVDEDGNFNTYLDTIDLKELYEILKGSE